MSGQKANSTARTAHGAGVAIALNAAGAAPDWIMLLPIPTGGKVATVDGRGPYLVRNAQALAIASLQSRGKIPIDENHATDLAAPKGLPAPARGWIAQLDVRADGIYGRPEWSDAGAALMSEKAYGYISPVLIVDKAGVVLDMPRVSLTNTPNLRGMPALNATETDMDLLASLRKILGLADDADEAAVLAKVRDACGSSTAMNSIAKAAGLADSADAATVLSTVTQLKAGTALQSIAKAAGLKEDSGHDVIVAAVARLAAGASETVTALQSELATTVERLNALTGSLATDKATAFVDGAIREGRVGVKPLREHYITRHAASAEGAAQVEKEIAGLPKLGPSGLTADPPAIKDGKVQLNAAQEHAAKILGVSAEDYAKTLASEQV